MSTNAKFSEEGVLPFALAFDVRQGRIISASTEISAVVQQMVVGSRQIETKTIVLHEML
jgi:hypothetical protein